MNRLLKIIDPRGRGKFHFHRGGGGERLRKIDLTSRKQTIAIRFLMSGDLLALRFSFFSLNRGGGEYESQKKRRYKKCW